MGVTLARGRLARPGRARRVAEPSKTLDERVLAPQAVLHRAGAVFRDGPVGYAHVSCGSLSRPNVQIQWANGGSALGCGVA